MGTYHMYVVDFLQIGRKVRRRLHDGVRLPGTLWYMICFMDAALV